MRFIRRARDLGFTVQQIAELLALRQDRSRKSSAVKRLAMHHAKALQRKIEEPASMAETLTKLANCYHGDGRPERLILEDVSSVDAEPARLEARLFGDISENGK